MKYGSLLTAGSLFLACSIGFSQPQSMATDQKQPAQGQGVAIVTVVPSHEKNPEQTLQVSQQDIKEVKVDGKVAQVTGWTPLQNQPLELVLLISADTRTSFGTQLQDIKKFSQELPPHTQMAVAWMQNGRTVLAAPLSSDPAEISKGIALPPGMAGANASPYFSLSYLAKNWPSQNRRARREVVMICDGIDDFNPHYDPNDPYVQAALNDSVRSGLIVYSIFWPDQDRLSRFGWGQEAGQNLLTQLSAATGGTNFWQGFGSPVTLEPYLKNLRVRFNNQYALSFAAPAVNKPGIERLDFKMSVPSAKVDAPQQVLVAPNSQAER